MNLIIKKLLCLIVLFLFLIRAEAETHPLIDEMDLRYSYLNDPFDNGYTEERYNKVLLHLKKIYQPIIESLGGVFIIKADWGDGAVNAWASRIGNEYELEIPGGLARYHLVNEQAFMLTICHELGHLLGGEPHSYLISYEGQSDYYATLSCVEKLFNDFDFISKNQDSAVKFCENHEPESISLCQKSLSGAVSITAVFAEPQQIPWPDLLTPSPKTVTATLQGHPDPQCRLDTYVAGLLKAHRPLCWYKP